MYTDAMKSSRTPISPLAEGIISFLTFWFVAGLFLDGWAHNHIPELETFFTPWHAVFYSGYFATTIGLLVVTLKNMKGKKKFSDAVPLGYGYALWGCSVFFIGGISDMIWHSVFGVEADIDALLSPTHLILATGLMMMFSGPLRAWILRTEKERNGSLLSQLPLLLTMASAMSLVTFMTQYATFTDLDAMGLRPVEDAAIFLNQAIPLLDMMLVSVLLVGLLSIIMKRGRPAPGFLTILLTLNIASMSYMRSHPEVILAALAAGILGDMLLAWTMQRRDDLVRIRVCCFVLPMLLMGATTVLMLVQNGIWWSVHMWTGSVVISGMAGILQSFVAWPPLEKIS